MAMDCPRGFVLPWPGILHPPRPSTAPSDLQVFRFSLAPNLAWILEELELQSWAQFHRVGGMARTRAVGCWPWGAGPLARVVVTLITVNPRVKPMSYRVVSREDQVNHSVTQWLLG